MKSNEADIQKRLARRYRSLASQEFYLRYQDYWNSVLLQAAPDKPEGTVLDCGSGSGLLLGFLSRNYDHVYGLDLSHEMLKTGEESGAGSRTLVGCAQMMGLKDSTFDLVICKSSLHHTPEPDRAIREIYRVLKKDGVLIISEPCRDNSLWRNIGRAYTGFSKNFSGHHHLFRTRQIKELLTRNGFEIQTSRYFGLVGFPVCGTAQQFPVMNLLPFNHLIARFLIKTDELLIRVPVIKNLRWHIIIQSQKSGNIA
jgi:ubiquinone/menaquinone biosynthesis C-methylase UbiE